MSSFWSTQPVHRGDGDSRGVLKKDFEVVHTPIPLPPGYEWTTTFDVHQIRNLLHHSYVGDEWRLDYPVSTLKWALHKNPEWNTGIKDETGKLVGFISGWPFRQRCGEEEFKCLESDLLCVHSKHRHLGLSPLLIRELARKAYTHGIFQAVATSEGNLRNVKPFAKTTSWQRPLDVKALERVGYYKSDRKNSNVFKVSGRSMLRRATEDDIPRMMDILNRYFAGHEVAPVATESYVRRMLEMHTFIDDDEDKLVSFYEVLNRNIHTNASVRTAYAYQIINAWDDAIILANNLKFEVFLTLNVRVGEDTLRRLKFIHTSEGPSYYMYNYAIPSMTPTECAIVLV